MTAKKNTHNETEMIEKESLDDLLAKPPKLSEIIDLNNSILTILARQDVIMRKYKAMFRDDYHWELIRKALQDRAHYTRSIKARSFKLKPKRKTKRQTGVTKL